LALIGLAGLAGLAGLIVFAGLGGTGDLEVLLAINGRLPSVLPSVSLSVP
jgi:hypothetical protein